MHKVVARKKIEALWVCQSKGQLCITWFPTPQTNRTFISTPRDRQKSRRISIRKYKLKEMLFTNPKAILDSQQNEFP